jgi:class 3 adenylate cyclase
MGLETQVAISDHPLLDGMERQLVDRLTGETRRTYQQGETLCCEGEAADHLYLIVRGIVSVVAGNETLATRGPGSVIGEQAFIERSRRGATVTAVTQVDVLRLPHAVVEDLLRKPTFVRNLLTALSTKLSEATRERAIRYRRERLLFGEFRAHVSEEVAQRLIATGLDYGHPRVVPAVVLFTDIRDFTASSAELVPEDVAAQLSAYLDRAVDLIHAHGGMVDKFIGDAILAVWGGLEPIAQEQMASCAFACARELVEMGGSMTLSGRPISIGVGLNFGHVFMGNVGGEGKKQFTVLGNVVNLAARYEAQAKELARPIVLGPDLVGLLANEDRRQLEAHPDVSLKGAPPQTLYTWSPDEGEGSSRGELEL